MKLKRCHLLKFSRPLYHCKESISFVLPADTFQYGVDFRGRNITLIRNTTVHWVCVCTHTQPLSCLSKQICAVPKILGISRMTVFSSLFSGITSSLNLNMKVILLWGDRSEDLLPHSSPAFSLLLIPLYLLMAFLLLYNPVRSVKISLRTAHLV